jgi:hypothetical protein
MPVVLTALSVLAFWSFLAVVAFGLLRFRRTLESLRQHLEKVAHVVQAVETNTEPLGALGIEFAEQLGSAAAELARLGRTFDA